MINYIQENLMMVNEEVDRLLSTSPLLIRSFMKHLSESKGKGIRAHSVLVSALNQEHVISEDAIHFASSIELLHLATLVHDDIMDDASVRRGVLTLNKKYGRKTAVICGDYVLALALKSLQEVKDRKKYAEFDLTDTMQELALGELNQHLNNGNQKITTKQYLDIIHGKTAVLFAASFYAGAITVTDDREELQKYREFGRCIGMIFQLMDDCLDYESTESVALKPVASDFEQGVITLPLIHVFDQEPELREKKLTKRKVMTLVKKYEGVLFTKRKAQRYYDEAIETLVSMNASEEKKRELNMILDKAMKKV